MSKAVRIESGRGPDCPSELALDRFEQEELSGAEASAIREHVESCDHCRTALGARAAAFAELDPGVQSKMIDRIVAATSGMADRQSEPTPLDRLRAWWSGSSGWAGLATATAIALAFVFRADLVRWGADGGGEAVRSKGGISLVVFHERGGRVERASNRDRFWSGDRLRFGIDVPSAGHAMIIGIEADGTEYPCFPTDGSDRSREVGGGVTETLPGAIALDDSIGREKLFLVFCDRPFRMDEVSPIDEGRLQARGCSVAPFEIEKVAR